MIIVGPKNLATPAHFVLGLKPASRREKCPRTYKENPSGLEALPRTILSLAFQTPGGKDNTPAKAAS